MVLVQTACQNWEGGSVFMKWVASYGYCINKHNILNTSCIGNASCRGKVFHFYRHPSIWGSAPPVQKCVWGEVGQAPPTQPDSLLLQFRQKVPIIYSSFTWRKWIGRQPHDAKYTFWGLYMRNTSSMSIGTSFKYVHPTPLAPPLKCTTNLRMRK